VEKTSKVIFSKQANNCCLFWSSIHDEALVKPFSSQNAGWFLRQCGKFYSLNNQNWED